MNLYRIHYAWRNGGTSSSNIEYFEDTDAFLVNLLRHHLDIAADHNRRNWFKWMNVTTWLEKHGLVRERKTTRIVKAERMVNGEWEPVDYEVIEPSIVLKGVT